MKTNTANLYHCFICHDDSPEPVGPYSIEVTAFQAGWGIKLDHEQAKAICPSCTDSLLGAALSLRLDVLPRDEG